MLRTLKPAGSINSRWEIMMWDWAEGWVYVLVIELLPLSIKSWAQSPEPSKRIFVFCFFNDEVKLRMMN